jgi:serpin B
MHHIARRHFLTLLAVPLLASLLPSCGDDEPTTTAPEPPEQGTGEVRSTLERVSTGAADADAAVAAINQLGAALYGPVAADASNVVFSPASIAIALTMARAGARGETAAELDAALGVADGDGLHRPMNALDAALAQRSGERTNASDEPATVTLRTANSLWGQDGFGFEPAFLDLLAEEYGAGLRLVDYRSDPDQARSLVNAWVDDITEGRIPELLPAGSIDADTRLTLVNAIYLKAAWHQAFLPEVTRPGPFTTRAGTETEVPFMADQRTLPHASGDGWQATELAFAGSELALTLVVPDAGRLDDAEAALGAGLLDRVVDELRPTTVNLSLPRFDIETTTDLRDVLARLGVSQIFDPALADLSGMTAEQRLFLQAARHQANLTVDEEGAEAAAATALVAGVTSAPIDVVELVVDRPFLFALRDIPTGAVLFLGRVGDPSLTR